MDVGSINKKLGEMYKEHWENLQSFKKEYRLSSPLLIKVPKCYERQKTKLFVVGQQTDEWFEGNSVDKLMEEYKNFNFGINYRYTPFWDCVRKLEKELSINEGCIVWSNLNRMDDPKNKYKCPDRKIEKKMAKNFPFLPEEIRICNPDILVFFTGPYYDENIEEDIFPGVEYEELNNQKRVLAKISLPNFDVEAYRTYHPNYLFRKPKDFGKKGEGIIQSIISDFKGK